MRLSSSHDPVPGTVRPPSGTASVGPGPNTAAAWPLNKGLPSGTLYVLAGNDVYSIDVATGFVVPLGVGPVNPVKTVLTAFSTGVLVWSTQGQPERRLWYVAGPIEQPVGPLMTAASILPASGGTAWITSQQQRDPSKDAGAIWALANDRGVTGRRVRIRGFAVPDGAGGLLDVERTGVRVAGSGNGGKVVGSYLLGSGPDGLVVDSCTDNSCTRELRDRVSGKVLTLGPDEPPTADSGSAVVAAGALSPGNHFFAEAGSDRDGGFDLRVTPTTAPISAQTIHLGSRSTSLAWLSERWLAATTDDGLFLYDANADVTVATSLPLQDPTQLLLLPAA